MWLQINPNWQIDTVSLLIGVAVGFGLTVAGMWLRPYLQRTWLRISGWLWERLAYLQAGAEVRYRAETAEFVQIHHLGKTWGQLDQLFVSPRLLAPITEIDPTNPPDWGVGQLHLLWPSLAAGIATPVPPTITTKQLLLSSRRVLVANEAGCGKTTLLAYGAYRCATAKPGGDDELLAPTLPAFVHLAELDIKPETADPLAPLTAALQKRSNPLTATGLPGIIQQKARAGNLLLLLDGWDECAAAQRPFFANWLHQLLTKFPNIRVIMAAPLTGYGALLDLDFTLTSLLPWRPEQVEPFAAQWTKTANISQPPRMLHYWRPGQSALQNSLRYWLIAFSKERPNRDYDTLQTALTLLNNNQKPDDQTLHFWQRVAFTLLTQGKLALTPAEITAVAETAPGDKSTAAKLVKDLPHNLLFITLPNGNYRFLGQTWRDFLAAQHIAQKGVSETELAHLTDPDWATVWRFYVAQAGATELANRLLEAKEATPTRDMLFQVAGWLPEAPDTGEWRRQILILLGQIIRQPTFAYALRHRAVAALAQTGEPGVFTFLQQLTERSDPLLRQAGVAGLPHLGAEKSVEQLVKFLEDGDKLVRQTAVSALAWLNHPSAERPLLGVLVGSDETTRQAAAVGLATNGSQGMEILKEALEDEDPRVRRAAVEGLSTLSEPWVMPLLVNMERHDKDWAVRSAATDALETLRSRDKIAIWKPLQAHRQPWLVEYAAKEGRIVPEGAATRPFLVQILTDAASPVARMTAAMILGQLPARDALPALETATRDAEQPVREAAFTTICLLHRAYGNG